MDEADRDTLMRMAAFEHVRKVSEADESDCYQIKTGLRRMRNANVTGNISHIFENVTDYSTY